MDFSYSRVIVEDLAAAFSKRIGEAETQAWHRFCLRELDERKAAAAVKQIIGQEERFPTIAHFVAVAKSIRIENQHVESSELFVEIEQDVWIPLRQALAEMEAEKAEFHRQYAVAQAVKAKARMEKISASIGRKA